MKENEEPISSQDEMDDENSMYLALINHKGDIRNVTPISPGTLSTVQETLRHLKAVPVTPAKRARRVPPFPSVTSKHTTPLPGTEPFLMITTSFGPSVTKQPTLWNEGEGFDLLTPTGKLRIEGNTVGENISLQHYVASELGPEGLKELVGLIDVYLSLTQGQDQTQNVEVTAKQVLQRIGKGRHADDDDEQAHLLNTALYLARTFVIGRTSAQTRISPLLILESATADEFGTVRLRYHLGVEFYDALCGPKPSLYPLPTPRVIGYHGAKSHHELMLTFFLGNRLAQGSYSLYFTTLCLHSGLLSHDKLLSSNKNRMRDAQQVIFAIMQLERDGFLICEPHPDVDLILAVNILLGTAKVGDLAPARQEQLQGQLSALQGYTKTEQKTRRRKALQRLLNVDASREELRRENPEFCTRLVFHPGPQFLAKQKEILENQSGLIVVDEKAPKREGK
ncbi:hypothetical protein EI42_05411 [Thermosporothrix hazakensis]|jgi:hypothetical protein|uniref:Uncharacterized protein n=2 Tax=Thermosporothrix hazakensis TaxID=644383 RepID=A0A326TYS2_THEHA|nr:hypothetical protein [Thermosporothrix hazakensis]PZW22505.1 hypothetical protein EI42_05411 [Thermosporothrix hazakensis]GCE50194.1 hypothetical protein KTH_50630 [Thermosporothrix hazakensis]